MKSILTLLLLISWYSIPGQEYEYPYNFFTNSLLPGNYFYSNVKCASGSKINALRNRLPVSTRYSHSPGNSLELTCSNAPNGYWQASVYYHEIRGIDHFKPARYLSFWIKPLIPATRFPLVALMHKDSSLSRKLTFTMQNNDHWVRIVLPVSSFTENMENKPEEFIAVVFCQDPDSDQLTHTFYIDDIEFVPDTIPVKLTTTPSLISATGYSRHIDIQWKQTNDPDIRLVKIYRAEQGQSFEPVGVQLPQFSRFTDFTGVSGKTYTYKVSFLDENYLESGFSNELIATTRELSVDELMTMVQEASCRFYVEAAEANSGMALENIPGRRQMIATGASGFGIMAILCGTERNFMSRESSVAQMLKILQFLEKADSFHGVFPHFLDGSTGLTEPFFGRRDNGADLVETAFLFLGLLAARQYFSRDNQSEQLIREKITRLWERAEWDWFRKTSDSKFLYWHWSPDQGWIINHPLIGWNETMVAYLLAIASPTHAVPAKMYYTGWANQDSTGWEYRSAWSRTTDGAGYINGNTYYGQKLDVGVSNGGPLFFTHYSYLGYDPHAITDRYTNYFVNNQKIAKINYLYCVENPKQYDGYGSDAWGLSASDGPYDYSANEPVPWQDIGKLTPTGALASFPYTPEESLRALRHYYYDLGSFLWGPYGFRDAFIPGENWCSEIYMGLNQAPIVVMIENYRTGLIWDLFMKDPDIQNGMRKLEQVSLK